MSSPHAILDDALAHAAQTIVDAASGLDVSREQLAAAQDILNRKGVSAAVKAPQIPEAFARDAFATVFRLLGFPPIKWPSAATAKRGKKATASDFNEALAEA